MSPPGFVLHLHHHQPYRHLHLRAYRYCIHCHPNVEALRHRACCGIVLILDTHNSPCIATTTPQLPYPKQTPASSHPTWSARRPRPAASTRRPRRCMETTTSRFHRADRAEWPPSTTLTLTNRSGQAHGPGATSRQRPLLTPSVLLPAQTLPLHSHPHRRLHPHNTNTSAPHARPVARPWTSTRSTLTPTLLHQARPGAPCLRTWLLYVT